MYQGASTKIRGYDVTLASEDGLTQCLVAAGGFSATLEEP